MEFELISRLLAATACQREDVILGLSLIHI